MIHTMMTTMIPYIKMTQYMKNAKNYIEDTFISEKELICTLNAIFDNNTTWDLSYQTSWCKI